MGDKEQSGREPVEILNGWSAKASLQKVIFKQRPAWGQGAWDADVGGGNQAEGATGAKALGADLLQEQQGVPASWAAVKVKQDNNPFEIPHS